MNVTAINSGNTATAQRLDPVDRIDQERASAHDLPDPQKAEKQVSSSEMLDKIKDLSQDGLYSVRFEMNKDINSLVIRVVDKESGEVVRQIPAEELIRISKTLKDLRGLMVNTES